MKKRRDYQGPALFSYGFRPFFLSSLLFALLVIPVWYLVWRGEAWFPGHFAPVDWHIHEMIFGYGAAVLAGFLFTAVPNWTGRLPTQGRPLAILLAIWIAGRLACAGLTGAPALIVMLIDQLFLLAVAGMIAREIIAGKNWRNLKVLVPVTLLWLANLLFHFEAASGGADISRRIGIALMIFLITLIGGRIIPSFTRNWLAKRGAEKLPAPFSRFDALCLAGGAVALIAWCLMPFGLLTAVAGLAAAALHLLRMLRWCGQATWRSPLVLMLHVSYFFIPLGFLAVALAAADMASEAVSVHLFGIGAIGSMTVAVMMRATMGHTGQELIAGPVLSLAFALLPAAALARTLGGTDGVALAALLWSIAFALLACRLAPMLIRRK